MSEKNKLLLDLFYSKLILKFKGDKIEDLIQQGYKESNQVYEDFHNNILNVATNSGKLSEVYDILDEVEQLEEDNQLKNIALPLIQQAQQYLGQKQQMAQNQQQQQQQSISQTQNKPKPQSTQAQPKQQKQDVVKQQEPPKKSVLSAQTVSSSDKNPYTISKDIKKQASPTYSSQQFRSQPAPITKQLPKNQNLDDMPPPTQAQKRGADQLKMKIVDDNLVNDEQRHLRVDEGEIKRMSSSEYIINHVMIKENIAKKIRDKNISQGEGVIDAICDAYEFYIKNIVDKLLKNSYIEFETEKFFENKSTNGNEYQSNIWKDDDNLQTFNKDTFKDKKVKTKVYLVESFDYTKTQKAVETYDNSEQQRCEEKYSEKNSEKSQQQQQQQQQTIEEKITKRFKFGNDTYAEIFKILVKNKSEKSRENEGLKKKTEETNKAIDMFMSKPSQSQQFASQSQRTDAGDLRQSASGLRGSASRRRISLRNMLHFLENDPYYKKSFILYKAYLK